MSKSVLSRLISETLESENAISSVEEARQLISAYQAECKEFDEAVSIHAKLAAIQTSCRPGDTRMAIFAVNEALSAFPELQMEMVSMESNAEDHYEVAMEGIGDIIASIADYVKDKFKKLVDQAGKMKDAFTYLFKNEGERASSLLKLLDEKAELVEGDVSLGKTGAEFFQAGGKPLDPAKAISDVIKHNETTFSPKNVEKGIELIKAKQWKDFGDGLAEISKVMMALVKDNGLSKTNEIGDRPVSKTQIAYRSAPGLPANYYNYVLLSSRSIPGDKREFFSWDNMGTIKEAPSFAAKHKIETSPVLKEADLKKVLTAIQEGSSSNAENAIKIANWARNLDGFFDAFFKQIEDLTLTKAELNILYSDVYSLATYSLNAFSDNLNYHSRVFDAYLNFAKANFK